MKKWVLLILFIIGIGCYIQAQSYDNYIQKAFELLDKGNVDAARRAYEVYKEMSNKSDSTFEELFDKTKKNLIWMDSCLIVRLSDTTSIAIQKIDPKQLPVKYVDAEAIARSSELFGFTDWTLPNQSEMSAIIRNLPDDLLMYTYYWCLSPSASVSSTVVVKRKTTYRNKNTGHISTKTENIPITNENTRLSYSIMSKDGGTVVTYEKDIETKNGIIVQSNIAGDENFKSHYIIVRVFRTDNPNLPVLKTKESGALSTINLKNQ